MNIRDRDPRGIKYIGLIIFLCLSAVFLLFADRLFYQGSTAPVYKRVAAESVDVLGIRSVVFYNGFERRGAMYDREKLAEAVPYIREPLQRALDTAGAVQEATESDWRIALASQSIYIDLMGQVPAEIFWDTFGVPTCPVEGSVTGAVLYANSGRVMLTLRCADDSYCTVLTDLEQSIVTSVSFEKFPALRLAAELGSPFIDALPSETVISEETVHALYCTQGISLAPEGFEKLSRLLTAFSVNPYTDSTYTEDDGTRIYKNSAGTLSVSEEGTVCFQADEGTGLSVEQKAEKTELQNGLSAIYSLLCSAVGTESLSSYYLESVSEGEQTAFTFGLRVGSLRVSGTDREYKAAAVLEDGNIVSMEFTFCGLAEDDHISITGLATAAEQLRSFSEDKKYRSQPPVLTYIVQPDIAVPGWIG